MSDAKQVQKGMRIENRYRIVRKIAEGGMATVYQAQDERLSRPVAIKIMHTQLAQGVHREQFIARFRREATSAAQIANPHIVQVYDTGEFEGLDYLVMEYVHGVNLRYEMNMHGTFSVKDTLRLLAQTLDGLASAHIAGVVHRDIKPENILINDRGNVQITDFGLARAISQATLSSTGLLLGTAAYLAPEMIEKNLATPQGDLYSAGTMAWEMLAGKVPFTADNPVTLVFKHVHEDTPSITTVCTGINIKVAKFLEKLTSRDMNLRPDNASEALAELRTISKELTSKDWSYRFKESEIQSEDVLDDSTMLINSRKLDNLKISNENEVENANEEDTSYTHQNTIENPSNSEETSELNEKTAKDSANETSESENIINLPDFLDNDIRSVNDDDIPLPPSKKSNELNEHNELNQDKSYDIAESENNLISKDNTQAKNSSTNNITQAMPWRSAKTSDVDYNYNNDPLEDFNDSNLPTIALEKSKIYSNSSKTKETQGKTSRKKVIFIAITILASIFIVACAIIWYFYGPNSYWTLPKPDDLSCSRTKTCKIADIKWENYERTLKVAGIPYKVELEYSDDIDSGNVISTTPDLVGSHINKHNHEYAKIIVSRGIKQATIPIDILSSKSNKPIEILRKAGFTNIIHRDILDMYSLDVPKGEIIDVSPQAGTTTDHNKPVTVILSKGPMPVEMPDIVNKSKDNAQQSLNDLKLNATYSEEYSDTVSKGNVISASKPKGEKLHWGDSVSIVISKGPQTVIMPDVRGKNKDEARKILEDLGLQVKISAPLGDFTHVVRLQSTSPGKEVRLKDNSGNATVITLTVV